MSIRALDQDRVIHTLVRAYLAQFGADYQRFYEAHRDAAPFSHEVWYRAYADRGGNPALAVHVYVDRPVRLTPYLARLATRFQVDVEPPFVILPEARLMENLDRQALKLAGWDQVDVPMPDSDALPDFAVAGSG